MDQLLDELVKGRKPEEIIGEEGLLKELTSRMMERALDAEMTKHLGYEPLVPGWRNRHARGTYIAPQVLSRYPEALE